MSGIKARTDKIARRYGGVLFKLASENSSLSDVMKDLKRLEGCIEAEPLEWSRVISPSLPLHTQRKIIKSLLASLKLGKLMSRFLMTLCENRRLPHLKLILEEFLAYSQRAKGIQEGILETTIELSSEDIQSIQKSLTSQLKQDIVLHQEIKESLLGGVVLRIGSLMIDASTRTQLKKLQTAMKG